MRYFLLYLITITLATSCTFVQKVNDGATAYDRKQYAVALPMLKKDYNKSKSRVEKGKLAYQIGESFTALHQPAEAVAWYKIAYDNNFGVDALKGYAYSLKSSEQYEDAGRAFKELGIEIGSPYEYRKEIAACKTAQGWKAEKRKAYSVTSVDFNSAKSDYSPVLFEDGQLVFTSDRATSTNDETYNWTGNAFSDLYVLTGREGSPSLFAEEINTAFNEGTATFNADFTEVYFTRCFGEGKFDDYHCKLMMANKRGSGWTVPRVLPFVQEGYNYMHPSLSANDGVLYFTSNNPDGWGGYDIYFVERTKAGWDEPQLMSRSINTMGDEQFPYVDKDTLYFASDAHGGMGGLDIYKTFKMDNGAWTPVLNLLPPVNSGADDFGYVVDYESAKSEEVLQAGYFTSSRAGGQGSDDIYRFEKRPLPPPPPVEEPELIVYKLILKGFVLEKIYQFADNPNSKVLGRKPLAGAKVNINFGKEKKTVEVSEDGSFELELATNTDYSFLGMRDGYLNNTGFFSTKGIGQDPNNPVQTFEVEIVLDKIFKNQEITLDNIYYDFDAARIRDDAKPTLNKLAQLLELNPTLQIQLGSHTDCQGNDRYNEQLSQRRAQSAVEYLITQGISASRLRAKGYGENNLAIDCVCTRCAEEEHQANRRTTFAIVE